MEFKDKVVMITGSGAGIGRETALLFAKEGARVVISDINIEAGKSVVKEIEALGASAAFVACDVSDVDDVKNLINQTIEVYGRLDIAINNAGIGGGGFNKTAEVPESDWDQVVAINQSGVFYCMKYELQVMAKQGSGCIINTASIAGLKGLPNATPYVASKFAVVGMTRTAAMEYAKTGIRINAVCPVFTLTNLFQPEYYGPLAEKLKAGIPMKRFAEASEIAQAYLMLASEKRASFITGLALPVDGGITA